MARFKDWLITEDGGDEGSNWFYGNSVYPTDASDWQYDVTCPSDFSLLQARWQKECDEWGRKFHGLDPNSTIKHKFTSVYSKTMPDLSDKGWKHNPKERKDVDIDQNAQMVVIGDRKNHAKINSVLNKSNDLIDKTDELNKTFGKFTPNMWQLPTNFDEPWSPYTGSVKMKYAKKKTYGGNINNFG